MYVVNILYKRRRDELYYNVVKLDLILEQFAVSIKFDDLLLLIYTQERRYSATTTQAERLHKGNLKGEPAMVAILP